MKLTKYFAFALAGTLLMSCGEEFLNDMDSSTVTPEQIQQESNKDPDKILSSQLKGCYTNWNTRAGISGSGINSHMSCGFGGIMMLSDVMSNDISLALGSGDPWRFDHTLIYNGEEYVRAYWPWSFFYTVIKSANELISVVDEETASDEVIHMVGQAYAFRGISHAYLAQFYQKTYDGNENQPCVPIRLSSKETSINSRATVQQVYDQAEKDLLKAIDYLDGYVRSDKSSIDKQVAQGLLSRVYLVMHRWADAATMAHDARQGYPLNNLEQALAWNYQDNSNQEVLWAFIPTESNKLWYASWASWHSIDGPGYGGAEVGAFQLIDAALYESMPDNDVRKELYVAPGTNNPSVPDYANVKFRFVSQWMGNVVYLRSSELYLNEAEGLLNSGNAAGATTLMNEFLSNRIKGFTGYSGYTAESIYRQRRAELWGEGFGYFDCLRMKQDLVRNYEGTNEPVGSQANISASSWMWIYQIPLREINDNDEITEADQNPVE